METITCKDLWKELLFSEPDGKNTVSCKERMAKYSKDDWSIMAKEAIDLTNMLAGLVENKDKVFDFCENVVKDLDSNLWDGRKSVTVK